MQARKPSFRKMFSSAFRTAAQGLELPETSTTNFRARSKSFLKPETFHQARVISRVFSLIGLVVPPGS